MTTQSKAIQRFNLAQRIEHVLLIVSFTTLVLTGIPQKFAASGWAEAIIAFLGGIEAIRIIHRIAATVFILETIYHVIYLAYKVYVQKVGMTMLPGIQDARDAMQSLMYNLGFTKTRPQMGRYTFEEKAEYWAMIWGSVIMVITGFMLWNPIATTRMLPGQFIPAAKTAHGSEALLAALAILIWHFYHVHIKHFNKSIFTGNLSRHEMEEFHPAELREIDSGAPAPEHPAGEKRRRSVFLPLAALFSIALLIGVYYFITFEETAITTLPPAERAQAFVPGTPTPAPTSAPQAQGTTVAGGATGPLTWDGSIGALFQQRCSGCHGSSGGFSVETYAQVMQGGAKGVAIIAGNPDSSPLVVLQAGNHPGKFNPDELARVQEWIAAGAPEQ